MPQDIKELLTQISHHETMANHHTSMATSLRVQYQAAIGDSSVDWGNGVLKRRPTKSHGRWVAWLSENGPAPRKKIADDVGLLTGEIPPYADTLGLTVDSSFPDNTLMRLSADNGRDRGRPVDVFFLWHQRFDVRPLFGVGPTKPEFQPIDNAPLEIASVSLDTDGAPGTMLGVVQPPPLDEPADVRYATVEEWEQAHASLFDRLVATDSKPTADEKELLTSTTPEGIVAGPLIAMAWTVAVQRARS
jgi:hypothetical protein